MRRSLWLSAVLVFLTTPFACGDDDATTGAGGNTGTPCAREADCDDDDVCTFDFCIDRTCRHEAVPNGAAPGDAQTDGDCLEVVCRDGQARMENDDDPPSDDNDQDCTIPVCVDGSATTGPAEVASFCRVNDNMFGVCDDAGVCSCAPPTTDTRVFVDADNGVDAPENGAGRGACAYATLDYALSRATGEIVLTDDAYDSENATFPITLTANQYLRCDRSDDQVVTTITGSGAVGATTATVVYGGMANGIQWCIIDGEDTADSCVTITSEGAGEFDHWMWQSRVRNCGTTGVEVTDTGNNVFVEESTIEGSGTQGMLWSGEGKQGYLRGNTFSDNGTDIVCTDASPGLDGDSNGGPSCSVCDNCPF